MKIDGFAWLTGDTITGTMIAVAIALTVAITVGALDALIKWVALRQGEDWRGEGNVPPRWWRR